MIPLSTPNLLGNERKYLNECIDTTFVSSVGEFVNRFENMVAKVSGVRYATATSSGTTGLHTALMVCGVKRNELVIIPSYTFIATANSVAHCGATPWCIEVDEQSWTMSPRCLQEELERNTYFDGKNLFHTITKQRVAAIMPVYTLGLPADMDSINTIANRYNLPVIADAAAAIGAEYKKEPIGKIADITVYSFNGNKTITCGGGGMLVSDNKELIDQAKHIATTARIGTEYNFDMIGYNYRMTNVQAAIGCAQVERLDEFLIKKRQIRQRYDTEFENYQTIQLFPKVDYANGTCWFSGIVFKPDYKKSIYEVIEKLKDKGIESRLFWKPVHLQVPYLDIPKSKLNFTDRLWDRILTLPCSTHISDAELDVVLETVKLLLTKNHFEL